MKKNSLVLFLLVCLTAFSAFSQTNNFSQDRIINVDLTKTRGKFSTMFKECIGAGRANEGLSTGKSDLILYMHNYSSSPTVTTFKAAFDNFRVVKR